MTKNRNSQIAALSALFWCVGGFASGCSSVKDALALDNEDKKIGTPIRNPFFETLGDSAPGQSMIVRSKQGDRSVEISVPTNRDTVSDMIVPVDGNFGRSPASDSGVDNQYQKRKPTAADHQITSNFPHSSFEEDAGRRDVEKDLGLMPSESDTPKVDASYLAGIDHIKQLFHIGRYEAALLEVEDLLHLYPTSPRLFEMRGTLLDRVGQTQLAIQSWNEALHYDPGNVALKRFVERKTNLASVPDHE